MPKKPKQSFKETPKYVGDFETTSDSEDRARVWASGMYNIDTKDFEYGTSMEWTMNFWFNHPGIYYYHNLKFDGGYILPYLFNHGFTHIKDGYLKPRQFKTIISDMGQFYCIEIMLKGRTHIKIYDSYKIITLSVSDMGKAFNLPERKGEIDYNLPRPIGYKLTPNEIDYLRRDCTIVGTALKYMFDHGLTKWTQGSNAYGFLKKEFDDSFRNYFPVLPKEIDNAIRKAYRGGFTYVAERALNRDIGPGLVYDKNSMYPTHMRYSAMPWGDPVYFTGRYTYDKNYPLFVQCFTCEFELKEGYLPTIQDKTGKFGFLQTEYLKSSKGNEITMTLTNLDLEIFYEHYNVINPVFHYGFKFMQSYTLFSNFVDYWYEVKEKAKKDGNFALAQIAKIMLNSCYGKFGTNPERAQMVPYMGLDSKVHYDRLPTETIDGEYIPVAAFITAWARYDIITQAQKLYDRFLYADTDSLHLEGLEKPDTLKIDKYELGAWDCETIFNKARYIRQKTYMEVTDTETILKCAGLPHDLRKYVTWDNFYPGLELFGKLVHTTVINGVLLKPTTFKIKP